MRLLKTVLGRSKSHYWDSRYIYQNELDKACFQHDIAYRDFKDLNRRTSADTVLRDKAFDIPKNKKNDGCQRELAAMV